MATLDNLIPFLRGLGYGGLLGAGILGTAFLLWPRLFPGAGSLDHILIVGGVLGAGAHRLLEALIGETFLFPIGRFLNYYGKLIQLVFIRRAIGSRRQQQLVADLTEQYFLGEAPKRRRLGGS